MTRAGVLATFALCAAGCGRVGFGAQRDGAAVDVPRDTGADAIACETPLIVQHPNEGVEHQDGGVIEYVSNPPASGTHYPDWTKWDRAYDQVIPRGYWVHDLEHGGVIYLWNCPDGCADDVARLAAMLAALPADPICVPPQAQPTVHHRALVTEDPELPAGVRFAASAWNYTWTSNCVDEASLTDFWSTYFDRGPEQHCDDGTYPP